LTGQSARRGGGSFLKMNQGLQRNSKEREGRLTPYLRKPHQRKDQGKDERDSKLDQIPKAIRKKFPNHQEVSAVLRKRNVGNEGKKKSISIDHIGRGVFNFLS